MSVPVTIENEHLRLDVWPHIGGKISSMIDKADGYELLFTFPQEMPTRCQYGTPYANGWFSGWDECFPAIAAGAYPLHPYEGSLVPDHGELWSLPTTAVPTRDGITTVWHGLRFGYRLTRKLYLEDRSVVAGYTLVNLAPFDFRFCWAQHALLSTVAPVQIDMGEVAWQGGGAWPTLQAEQAREGESLTAEGAAGVSFDRSDALPPGAWKRFSANPIARRATLLYPTRNRAMDISYHSESGVPAYWGVWVNNGGWEGHKHLAIEPTTGRYDAIDRCISDDTAGLVPASRKVEWQTRFDVRSTAE